MYIMDDDGNLVPCTVGEWSNWRASCDNHVAADTIGAVFISTIMTGVDYRMGDDGPPLVFETMVFDRDVKGRLWDRYSTRAEALLGHAAACKAVRLRQ